MAQQSVLCFCQWSFGIIPNPFIVVVDVTGITDVTVTSVQVSGQGVGIVVVVSPVS